MGSTAGRRGRDETGSTTGLATTVLALISAGTLAGISLVGAQQLAVNVPERGFFHGSHGAVRPPTGVVVTPRSTPTPHRPATPRHRTQRPAAPALLPQPATGRPAVVVRPAADRPRVDLPTPTLPPVVVPTLPPVVVPTLPPPTRPAPHEPDHHGRLSIERVPDQASRKIDPGRATGHGSSRHVAVAPCGSRDERAGDGKARGGDARHGVLSLPAGGHDERGDHGGRRHDRSTVRGVDRHDGHGSGSADRRDRSGHRNDGHRNDGHRNHGLLGGPHR